MSIWLAIFISLSLSVCPLGYIGVPFRKSVTGVLDCSVENVSVCVAGETLLPVSKK